MLAVAWPQGRGLPDDPASSDEAAFVAVVQVAADRLFVGGCGCWQGGWGVRSGEVVGPGVDGGVGEVVAVGLEGGGFSVGEAVQVGADFR